MMSLVWEIELPENLVTDILVVPQLRSVYLADQGDSGTTARLKVKRLDIDSGQKLAEFPMRSQVNAVSFSPDYSTMLVNSDRRIYLLCTRTLKVLNRWASKVPSLMFSTVQVGSDLAMKSRACKNVSLYNLETSTVKRIAVGVGRSLFRDLKDDTFLVCCKVDGTVCRVNPTTRQVKKLFECPPFNFCAVDYRSRMLCIAEGLPGNYLSFSGRRRDRPRATSVDKNLSQEWLDNRPDLKSYVETPVPAVHDRLHLISLDESSSPRRVDLDFKFQAIGLSECGEFVWLEPEGENQEIRIVSLRDASEVARFALPNGERLKHADAPTGLIFTWAKQPNRSYSIRCWQTK